MTWFDVLPDDIAERGKALALRAAEERESGTVIYPAQSEIFRALELTPVEQLKVLVIGQDPYHGPGQANGLAFSVNSGVKLPPSLRNIFGELVDDVGCSWPVCGDLTPWAEQGVLLLNTSLTVEEGLPNSHCDWGWHEFTRSIFQVALRLPQPVVFILWGKNAQTFAAGIDFEKYPNKRVLMSTHPSPFSARKASGGMQAFMRSRPFSNANRLLQEMGSVPIDWKVEY